MIVNQKMVVWNENHNDNEPNLKNELIIGERPEKQNQKWMSQYYKPDQK